MTSSMEQSLANIVEAILFVSGEPVDINEMQRNLNVPELDLMRAVDTLQTQYEDQKRGICLKRFGSHVQLATRAEYAPFVEKMLQPVQKQSLSRAALETLAVVAYRQPVTRLDIEMVRGVKCDYSLQSLVLKGLIQAVGRKDTVGHPILYATTDMFLSHFALASLSELPKPPEKSSAESTVEEAIE
ncbi:MAG: SMC-Scp complex subunit ScpB [Eubacteriales bacterium]|nr:SMC-Scp complex subunit ScpB [Eubacteriales bacterium]MDD4105619.1 SMC-Scp complex subunit ScpB [Eubacteriales bacterium]MDD4711106.1 SMC-Scp complex subunit ScpB [Eubacteriales bacterium]NLO14812.1 SMC-Scp complex subunit ScpB [Clostridiales bacterium]